MPKSLKNLKQKEGCICVHVCVYLCCVNVCEDMIIYESSKRKHSGDIHFKMKCVTVCHKHLEIIKTSKQVFKNIINNPLTLPERDPQ